MNIIQVITGMLIHYSKWLSGILPGSMAKIRTLPPLKNGPTWSALKEKRWQCHLLSALIL
jgi:hypothetical protein